MNELENQIIQSEQTLPQAPLSPDYVYTFVQIAQDVYALDSKNVLEIIKFIELNRPEQLPSHIAGLLEYNGKIINIVDIKSVLKIERTPYDINSMIVILNCDNYTFGVIVNKVLDIKKIDIRDTQPTPYISKNNFISAIYTYNDVQCSILNNHSLSAWVQKHNEDEQDSYFTNLIPNDPKSQEILHKRKLDLIEKSKKNPYSMFSDKDEFVSFNAGDNKYCIKMKDIKGFYKVQTEKMTKVPCTADFILGLINIKGDFICVIDIMNYFHSKKCDFNPTPTVIILNSDEFKIGILADTIGDNIQIKPEEIQSLSRQDTKPELSQYVKESDIFLIINVPEMLTNDKLFIR